MNQLKQYDNVVTVSVDQEVDFCPGGALGVTEGDQTIEPMNALARWTRDQNGQVIFTRDWHPPQTTHFDTWGPHCVRNTPGSLFHPDLEVLEHEAGDVVISKGMGADEDAFSGFDGRTADGKNLRGILLERVNHNKPLAVLMGGLATDYCVKATALGARALACDMSWTRLDIDVYVAEDAIRAVNLEPGDGEKAIAEMKDAGIRFVTTEDVINGNVLQVSG